jgi:hypothetical protein
MAAAASQSKFPPGIGKVLDQAMKNAYAHAVHAGGKPPFVVEKIVLEGTNPFTEYKVFLLPGG